MFDEWLTPIRPNEKVDGPSTFECFSSRLKDVSVIPDELAVCEAVSKYDHSNLDLSSKSKCSLVNMGYESRYRNIKLCVKCTLKWIKFEYGKSVIKSDSLEEDCCLQSQPMHMSSN